MKEKAALIADRLLSNESVHIVSHIDADGIASASIAYRALERAGKDVSVEFVKQLDESEIERIREESHSLIWFTDLGSGQMSSLKGMNCVITDHHEPENSSEPSAVEDRENILSYCTSIIELNPHDFGLDGAKEISGAGTTYLVAKQMDKSNKDLSKLAVIGAVGDLQASEEGRLVGLNRDILDDGAEEGMIEIRKDTTLYGLESRPLHKVLEYASDPILPGLTGDESSCVNFLVENDIGLKEDNDWRRWHDLTREEKKKILSGLAKRILRKGYPPENVKCMIGEIYILPEEESGTMLHQAKEFSTLLNSCGRYEEGKIGLKLCLGDRDEYLKKAKGLLEGHQKILVDCLDYVESIGVEERESFQFFHGEDRIPDTVVGTVAGMVLGSGNIDKRLPILAFANSEEREGVKVSSRGTKRLVDNGLDLSSVMSKCAQKVGGEGGGHDIAAGALIPEGKEEEFMDEVGNMIGSQLE
ncbi:MAG: DHH family phosphoesterase [Candidatus Thermoplasmatota archaeon]